MKRQLLILFGLIISTLVLAQVPQGISHQAVMRDAENNLLVESPIGLRVSILQGAHDGDAVYVETHHLMTNQNGLISYIIGDGDAVQGVFQEIDWAEGPYWLETKADPEGGTNYSISGMSMFLSVPYSFHAKTAEEYAETDPLFAGWDKSEGIEITEDQVTDLKAYLLEEDDPIFNTSAAAGIEEENINNWEEAFSWGDHHGLYRPENWTPGWEDMPLGDNPGEIRYWDGNEWLAVVPGEYGQTLSFCNGIPVWGPCPPSVPIVITGAVTGITENTATGAGTVVNQGSASVSIRGLVWGTGINPTLQDNEGSASSGSGTGSFSVEMTGLHATTAYHVRAYATNSEGTAYGNQVTFTTDAPTTFPPTISTSPVTEVTQTSAVTGGHITDDGGSAISLRGVVWHTSVNPSLEHYLGQTTDGVGVGVYVSQITGLEPNTSYYVRAYAVNSQGVSYGNQRVFVTQHDGNLPTVVTAEATDITQTTATTGGEVTDDGGSTVLSRGVCWSTQESPTLSDDFVESGTGLGVFTSELTGLDSGTTYYVRAFATSNQGIAYGNQVSFTTDAGLPEVSIVSINYGQPGLRVVDGEVNNDGGAEVTVRGFVWDTAEDPTLAQNEGYSTDGAGQGAFTTYIVDLTPNTKYFIRAYATNSVGTEYSEQQFFHFWNYHGMVTDIDGNVYQTVVIGDQEWMTENLRTSSYSNGIPIPTGLSAADWASTTQGAYVIYENNANYLEGYGKLYNWFAVNDPRGLCPQGWSVPSDDDWTDLVDYLVDQGFPNSNVVNGAGNALKSCRQSNSPMGGACNTSTHPYWSSHNTHFGFDEFGFSALPGGRRSDIGAFSLITYYGYWWSSSELSATDARNRYMRHLRGDMVLQNNNKQSGLSVRCFRNIE